MASYQTNIINKIKSKNSIDSILNMSWNDVEKILGEKISRNNYKNILGSIEQEDIDDQFLKAIPLMESKQDVSVIRDRISAAIRNRWYLAVYYIDDDDDTKVGFRLIEPYVVGRGYRVRGVVSENHKNDYYLRCFVIKDAKEDKSVVFKRNKSYSYSREEPYWRVFRLDRILNLVIIKRKIRWYRPMYTGGSDANIVERMEWANIRDFAGENPHGS